MFDQVLSGGSGYISGSSSATAGGFFPDFEAQIPPAAIFPINTVNIYLLGAPASSTSK